MQVISSSFERRLFSDDATDDYKECIRKRDAECEERRCDFSPLVDTEESQHESKEHRSGITHQHAHRGEVEEGTGTRNPCQCERKERDIHFSIPEQCEESDEEKAERGNDAHLATDTIEPVHGVDGEE